MLKPNFRTLVYLSIIMQIVAPWHHFRLHVYIFKGKSKGLIFSRSFYPKRRTYHRQQVGIEHKSAANHCTTTRQIALTSSIPIRVRDSGEKLFIYEPKAIQITPLISVFLKQWLAGIVYGWVRATMFFLFNVHTERTARRRGAIP